MIKSNTKLRGIRISAQNNTQCKISEKMGESEKAEEKKAKSKPKIPKNKVRRPKSQEIYITKETPTIVTTNEKEIKQFCNLLNQTVAIAYGYWGAMWRTYFWKTNPVRYMIIQSEDRLYSRIIEVQFNAQSVYDQMVKELLSNGYTQKDAEQAAKTNVINDIIHNEVYFE